MRNGEVIRISPSKDALQRMTPDKLRAHGFRSRDERITRPLLTCCICEKKVRPDYDVCVRCEAMLQTEFFIPIEEERL